MVKRSECRCSCHFGLGAVHIVACCEPDTLLEAEAALQRMKENHDSPEEWATKLAADLSKFRD